MIDPDKIGELIVKGWSSREGKDGSERMMGGLEESRRLNGETCPWEEVSKRHMLIKPEGPGRTSIEKQGGLMKTRGMKEGKYSVEKILGEPFRLSLD